MATKEEWFNLSIFVSEWIGFAFLLISVTSYNWHNVHHCTVGLFYRCESCTCLTITEDLLQHPVPEWLKASQALMILGVITGFGGMVADIVRNFLPKSCPKKSFKLSVAIVYIFTVIFTAIGAGIFTKQGAKELFSPDVMELAPSTGEGYGYILAWFGMALFIVADVLLWVLWGCIDGEKKSADINLGPTAKND